MFNFPPSYKVRNVHITIRFRINIYNDPVYCIVDITVHLFVSHFFAASRTSLSDLFIQLAHLSQLKLQWASCRYNLFSWHHRLSLSKSSWRCTQSLMVQISRYNLIVFNITSMVKRVFTGDRRIWLESRRRASHLVSGAFFFDLGQEVEDGQFVVSITGECDPNSPWRATSSSESYSA
jgi:hypothetical protein